MYLQTRQVILCPKDRMNDAILSHFLVPICGSTDTLHTYLAVVGFPDAENCTPGRPTGR